MEHQSTESQKLPLWLHEAVENNSEKSKDPIILHTYTHKMKWCHSNSELKTFCPLMKTPKYVTI